LKLYFPALIPLFEGVAPSGDGQFPSTQGVDSEAGRGGSYFYFSIFNFCFYLQPSACSYYLQ